MQLISTGLFESPLDVALNDPYRVDKLPKVSICEKTGEVQHIVEPWQIDPNELQLLLLQKDMITIKTRAAGPTKHWQIAVKQPRKLLCTFSTHLASKLSDTSIKILHIDNDKIDKDSVYRLCKWMEHYCCGLLKYTDAGPYDWHERFAFWFTAQCWKVDSVLIRLALQLRADLECITLETATTALSEARSFGPKFPAIWFIDSALQELVNFWATDVWDLNMLCRHKVSERVLNRAVHRFFLLHRGMYPKPQNVPHYDRLHWTARLRLIKAYGKDTSNPLKRRRALRCL